MITATLAGTLRPVTNTLTSPLTHSAALAPLCGPRQTGLLTTILSLLPYATFSHCADETVWLFAWVYLILLP